MWVYTGTSLVNVREARAITVERENASDRLTVFTVAGDFGEGVRVPLARIELVFPTSLIVALGPDDPGLRLSPREQAERRARGECDACLRALAQALAEGLPFCDLSALYTPLIQADGD